MADLDDFLGWVMTSLYEAEVALHSGDASPRRALWSRNEPVSVMGAWRNAFSQQELDVLFASLAAQFSNFGSFRFELLASQVLGGMAYTAGLEHISTSVDGEPRSFVLRVTQAYPPRSWRMEGLPSPRRHRSLGCPYSRTLGVSSDQSGKGAAGVFLVTSQGCGPGWRSYPDQGCRNIRPGRSHDPLNSAYC
jgi:hypothetical protein